MKIEDYCLKNGYSISEVDILNKKKENDGIHDILEKKDILEVLGKQNKTLEGKIVETPILENGNKKIVFAKGWNEQCGGSALFLNGDFYFAIDSHLDFYEYGKIYHTDDKEDYTCGMYRCFILENFAKQKKKPEFFIAHTKHCHQYGDFRFERIMPYIEKDIVCFDYKMLKYRTENINSAVKAIRSNLRKENGEMKKGVVCLDYDILTPSQIKQNGLWPKYGEEGRGIDFESLKLMIKEIMANSEILTFFVDIPFEKRNFLEKLLG